jgi:hypothetical protein
MNPNRVRVQILQEKQAVINFAKFSRDAAADGKMALLRSF